MAAGSHRLPDLSDGRVVLRAAEARDVLAIDAGIRDPDVIRWIGSQPSSAEEVLSRDRERWRHGEPALVICEPDGSCVGKVWVGFRGGDRSTGYVGYWLLPAGRGRGLAASAVRLISSWARRELGVANLRITTEPGNAASQRVAERSGFRRISASPDEVVFALERPSRILVTGMSGTGKSAVLAELGRRGYRVVDTDEPGWRQYRAYAESADDVHRGEWLWVDERLARLLASGDGRSLFVAGCVRNQSAFYDRFDAIVLLSAPLEVLLDRVARRTTNEYGKSRLERAMIVDDLANIEPALRAGSTHELDASRPLEDVVADLVAIASRPMRGSEEPA